MKKAQNPLMGAAQRLNDTLVAPFVVVPNMGFAAVNATIGTVANVIKQAATTAGDMPLGRFCNAYSGAIADRTLTAANDAASTVTVSLWRALGRETDRTANELLASTVLEKSAATATLPLWIAVDGMSVALNIEPIKQALAALGMPISQTLDFLSAPGVIPGKIGANTTALSRFGFVHMSANGPIEAIARDMRGIVGGAIALALGDMSWLAKGSRDFYTSMDYVVEKKHHGEVQPESDFPLGPRLAEHASAIIDYYPEIFVRALEDREPVEVVRGFLRDLEETITMFSRYPRATFRVLYDVVLFVRKALFDVSDAQNYALCELAIMESDLSNDEKDTALSKLRKTAPNTTIEYEFYVPLLVAFDGSVDDKAYRRDASGQVIDNHSVVPSVFKQIAMDIAQSLCSEVISLRSFMWLYGDEQLAREKNHTETIRKYGPDVAERIEENPRYPLTPKQLTELTASGPRPREEIDEIMDGLLRARGLDQIADRIWSGTLA